MRSNLPAFGLLFASFCSAQSATPYLSAGDVFGTINAQCPSGTSCGAMAAFPTGNGINAAILTFDNSQALTVQLQSTYLVFNGFNAAYSLYMQPTADSPIYSNYGYVGINYGLTTAGFSAGDKDGLLVWNNTDMANVGSFFGVCPTLIPGYESAGLQNQVFWQSNEAPYMGIANCTTINFHF